MINSVKYPNEYCFCGNPVMINIIGNKAEEVILTIKVQDQKDIILSIFLFGSGSHFEGRFDISNVLTSLFTLQPFLPSGAVCAKVDNFSLKYTLSIQNYGTSFSGLAFYGGVSDYNFSLLKSWGWDMFTYRLKNHEHQFLFTTRTNSGHIVLRETELYPFLFIHPGKQITLVSSNGKIISPEIYPADTLCVMDLATTRLVFTEIYGELPSIIAIMVDGVYSFDITLLSNQLSEESYCLRFRNSLGVFEVVELTGTATESTKFDEENTWQTSTRYNLVEEGRNRLVSQKTITASCGYKSKEEMAFILDMIKSEEVYFVDSSDERKREYRCLITPEEIKIPRNFTEPQSIDLKIRFISNNKYESPEIVLDYTKSIFHNLTAKGSPQINGNGLIYGDDYPFYAE